MNTGQEEEEQPEEPMTDMEFDESFLGKKLSELSQEEISEEVRCVFLHANMSRSFYSATCNVGMIR